MNNKETILLIEDDSFLLQMYATKLELAGFAVEVASDGAKGLQMAGKILPDLILLDLIMPKMDGFVVLEALKKNDNTKDIPVIILTNLGQREDVQKCLAMGAVDYMIKAHYVPAEVVSKIRAVLGQ
ncbi:MAG: response regulator transcription factor [Candidatus Komeilibacteria bacterium]